MTDVSCVKFGRWYWQKTSFTRFMRVPGGLLAESQAFDDDLTRSVSMCFIPMGTTDLEWFIRDNCDNI